MGGLTPWRKARHCELRKGLLCRIGEVLLDTMMADKASNLTYADIVQQSLRDTPIERLPVSSDGKH